MPITSRAAGIAIATAAAAAIAPSPALAKNAVYGGSTSKGAPIVINADKKAKTLKSAVVSWTAVLRRRPRLPDRRAAEGGRRGARLHARLPRAGDLAQRQGPLRRHAARRLRHGRNVGALNASYSGKLSAKRASGTLEATITVLEKASRNVVATCRTGSVRWSATRSPGRVFGGSTAQDLPIVVRLDAKRRTVADMLFNWESATCKPDDVYLNVNEGFAASRSRRALRRRVRPVLHPGRRRRGQGQLRHHRPGRAHARERQPAGQRHGDRPGGRRDGGVRQRHHPVGGRQRLSCSRAPATIAPASRSSDGVSILQRCR